MIALYDTSVWVWAQRDPELRADLAEAIEGDRVATCAPVMLELLYSARNLPEFREIREDLGALRDCPIGPREWSRVFDVYEELARQGGGHQRQVKHFDVLIAVAAESAGLPVVHYDEDYDRIAAVTGQPVEWARRRGAL